MGRDRVEGSFLFLPSNSEANTICIEITKGDFRGIIYHYETAGVVECTDRFGARVKFSYDIDGYPDDFDHTLLDDRREEFETLLGDILVYTVTSAEPHDT